MARLLLIWGFPLLVLAIAVGAHRALRAYASAGDGPGGRGRRALRVMRLGALVSMSIGIAVSWLASDVPMRALLAAATLVLPWLLVWGALLGRPRPVVTGAAVTIAGVQTVMSLSWAAALAVTLSRAEPGTPLRALFPTPEMPLLLAGVLLAVGGCAAVGAGDTVGRRLSSWRGSGRAIGVIASLAYVGALVLAMVAWKGEQPRIVPTVEAAESRR